MNAAAIEKLFADAAAQDARHAPWPNNTVSTTIIADPLIESANVNSVDDYDDDVDDGDETAGRKKLVPTAAKNIQGNGLPLHGNQSTMNLNNMVHANIIQSPYYRHHLNDVKTYQEVVDEIYYHVKHLEPWERGSRRTEGQVGMCGSVRGVGAGGIVSSAFCLLYKLHVLKLTKKQLLGLLNFRKTDKSGGVGSSPYVRGIGFMYIRYTQPPTTLWDWYEVFMDDDEYVDPKAGGGDLMTIGGMIRNMLSKLDWYGTLFPRIPVPVQKQIDSRLEEWRRKGRAGRNTAASSGSTSRARDRSRDRSNDNSRRKRRYADDGTDADDFLKKRRTPEKPSPSRPSYTRRDRSPQIHRAAGSSTRSSSSAEREKSTDDPARMRREDHRSDPKRRNGGSGYEGRRESDDRRHHHHRDPSKKDEINGKHRHRGAPDHDHRDRYHREHRRRSRSSSADRRDKEGSRSGRKY